MLKCSILQFKQVSLVLSKINPSMDNISTICTKGGNQNRYLTFFGNFNIVIINIIPSIKCPRGFNFREKNIRFSMALNG
jgi:hypothetical protein